MVCGCLDKPVATCSELLLRVQFHENQQTLNIFHKAKAKTKLEESICFLISNFHHVVNVVFFLLGDSPGI